mgnify:FL=1
MSILVESVLANADKVMEVHVDLIIEVHIDKVMKIHVDKAIELHHDNFMGHNMLACCSVRLFSAKKAAANQFAAALLISCFSHKLRFAYPCLRYAGSAS